MNIYLSLLGSACVPIALSVIFFLLKRKTKFASLPGWAMQAVIGVFFGAAAIFGTEYGVDVGGATANARDAAPLCAGLLFGAPAGIIAGLIGGVERWFAVLWGAGEYSRIACSVSTVFAGFYAAALRKWMFDDKRPTPGLGAAIAIVMEVLHLSILFLTHLSDAAQAYKIVQICTLPMVICNAAALFFSIFMVSLLSRSIHVGANRQHSIAQKVQSAMLICVVAAYFITTGFVFALQTGTAYQDAHSVISLTLYDIAQDVRDTTDAGLLKTARQIASTIANAPDTELKKLAAQYNVSEIHVIDADGVIANSSDERYVGFDMASDPQSAVFLDLNRNHKEYVQDLRDFTLSEDSGPVSRKYVGVRLPGSGYLQIGYSTENFQQNMRELVRSLSLNRHVGETGCVMIANYRSKIINASSEWQKATLPDSGIVIDPNTEEKKLQTTTIDGADYFWEYLRIDKYDVVAVLPQEEAFAMRNAAVYVNSFIEVIIFAALFALIYMLIKLLVVNNIRSVNNDLTKIIGGNLSVVVDVRASSEFSSLSDDINSTVTTLKHYISEAAARIDKELQVAKDIQLSVLPSEFPTFSDEKLFDLYATMNPAREVGGDFYDFYPLGEDKLAILIADVSGKGIPAAMFMMQAKTMLKNLAEENLPVNEIFTRANEKLCETNDTGMFVTAWMAIVDLKTGHGCFSNAGHNPPLIFRTGEGFTYLRSRAGLVLAGMDGIQYKMQEFDLSSGDVLFLYTDGVTEATDADEQLYGEDRLLAFLNAHADLPANETLSAVQGDIDAFVKDAQQFDDITMLMLRFFGKESAMKLAEKIFPAKTDALDAVNAFVQEKLEEADCGMKTSMQIAVALEELFVNVASYAYDGAEGDVVIRTGVEDGLCIIELEDSGKPFNPLQKTDPDVTLSAEERNIGGLGIFMVKKTMDDLKYRYENGKNILTIYKKI